MARMKLPSTVPEFCMSFDALPVYTFSLSFVLVERNFMNLHEIIDQLRDGRDRLNHAIAALEGTAPLRGRPPKVYAVTTRRVMSAAARKRISTAMKAQWAARKRYGSQAKVAKKREKKPSGHRQMSLAARKKLSELMKARWAAKKRA